MIKTERRKSFVFFTDWHKVLEKYDVQLRCAVYDAIIRYAETGEEPGLTGEAGMAFAFIKEDIDRNNRRYEELCARRREYARKGAEMRKRKREEAEEKKAKREEQKLRKERPDASLPTESPAPATPPTPAPATPAAPATPEAPEAPEPSGAEWEKAMMAEVEADGDYRQEVADAFGCDRTVIDSLWTRFRAECRAKRKRHTDTDDIRKHFVDWARPDAVKQTAGDGDSSTDQKRHYGKNNNLSGSGKDGGGNRSAAERGKPAYSFGLIE